jgi:hypothetical protein
MDYLPSAILALVVIIGIIVVAVRYKSRLWRWLFVVEVLFLLWSFGNCFVPGSWRQFWETELPCLAITAAISYASAELEIRANRREDRPGATHIFASRQMMCLYIVSGIIAVIVLTH